MAGLGLGDQSWGCSSGRARAPAQPVALPLWGSFPWCQGPCLGSSWPGSVPHMRISALTRGSSGWGEVFLSRCCCHPFSSWAGKDSCPRCFHTRRILDQKKDRKSSQTRWCRAGQIAQGSSGLCHINLLRPGHHPASPIRVHKLKGCGDEKTSSEVMAGVKNPCVASQPFRLQPWVELQLHSLFLGHCHQYFQPGSDR